MIKLTSHAYTDATQALADTLMREDATKDQISSAMDGLASAIQSEVSDSFQSANDDRAALASRGFKVLTSAEDAYFRKFAEAAQTSRTVDDFDSKMEHADLPQTVIDDVMTNVKGNHPFLAAINSRAVSRITKIYLNAGASQEAAWGDLDDAIAKEIVGSFAEIDATQNKLSAFAMVSKDELALGPTYLDALVTSTIAESIANGLEHGYIGGTGLKQPVGLDRDVHNGVTVSTTTGYPQKTAISVTDFSPASYGTLLAKLATDENGHEKAIAASVNGGVAAPTFALVCNLTDYLTKVMPATTVLNTSGSFVNGLFPVPTSCYTSAYVESGKALLCIPSEYYALVGGDRGLEMSDEYKFVEDKRVYKQVMYAAGRAKDDTTAVLLDISKLDPAYVTTKVAGTVATKASA